MTSNKAKVADKGGDGPESMDEGMSQAAGVSSAKRRDAGVENGARAQGAGTAAGLDKKRTAGSGGGAKPTVSHMLGELTWLLSQSSTHKHFSIGDLEWLVMPAILLEQFRVFHGEKHPLGFALWARFSEEAEKRFLEQVEAGRGARLRPQDWKSGDRLWLIELVAPFATAENKLNEAMLADLVDNVFRTEPFKLHVVNPKTGKREMKEIGR